MTEESANRSPAGSIDQTSDNSVTPLHVEDLSFELPSKALAKEKALRTAVTRRNEDGSHSLYPIFNSSVKTLPVGLAVGQLFYFTRNTWRYLFLTVGFVLVSVVCNVVGEPYATSSNADTLTRTVSLFNQSGSGTQGEVLYIVTILTDLAATLLFSVWLVGLTARQERRSIRWRKARPTAGQFSVAVSGLPRTRLTPGDIRVFFARYGDIASVCLPLDSSKFVRLQAARQRLMNKCERCRIRVAKGRERNKHDPTNAKWMSKERVLLDRLDATLWDLSRVEASLRLLFDSKQRQRNCGRAYITFERKESATLARHAMRRSMFGPKASVYLNDYHKAVPVIVYAAPEPSDIVWGNISRSKRTFLTRSLFSASVMICLVCGNVVVLFLFRPFRERINSVLWPVGTFASATITVTNFLIMKGIAMGLRELEKHKTFSGRQTGMMYKLLGAGFVSSGLTTLMLTIDKGHDTNVADDAIMLAVVHATLPHIANYIQFGQKFLSTWFKAFAVTQRELDFAYQWYEFNLAEQFAYVLKTIGLTMLFSTISPLVYLISPIGLFLQYALNKYNLLRRMRRPPFWDDRLIYRLRPILYIMLLVHYAVGIYYYSINTMGKEQEEIRGILISGFWLWVVGCGTICLVTVPMMWIGHMVALLSSDPRRGSMRGLEMYGTEVDLEAIDPETRENGNDEAAVTAVDKNLPPVGVESIGGISNKLDEPFQNPTTYSELRAHALIPMESYEDMMPSHLKFNEEREEWAIMNEVDSEAEGGDSDTDVAPYSSAELLFDGVLAKNIKNIVTHKRSNEGHRSSNFSSRGSSRASNRASQFSTPRSSKNHAATPRDSPASESEPRLSGWNMKVEVLQGRHGGNREGREASVYHTPRGRLGGLSFDDSVARDTMARDQNASVSSTVQNGGGDTPYGTPPTTFFGEEENDEDSAGNGFKTVAKRKMLQVSLPKTPGSQGIRPSLRQDPSRNVVGLTPKSSAASPQTREETRIRRAQEKARQQEEVYAGLHRAYQTALSRRGGVMASTRIQSNALTMIQKDIQQSIKAEESAIELSSMKRVQSVRINERR